MDTRGMGGGAIWSIAPMFFLPRFNAVIHAFRKETFAILSAFELGLELSTNLERQSKLVDAAREARLAWFPVVCDWGNCRLRSIFLHRQHDRHGDEQRVPEPDMVFVLEICRRYGLNRFIQGDRGGYIVFDGDPPLPLRISDHLRLFVDADFIAFHRSRTSGDEEPKDAAEGK